MRAPRARLRPVSWLAYSVMWVGNLWVRYFLTGRSLTGAKTDNATMWHAASKDYRDRPYETLTGPIWHRLARRWALVGFPVLAVLLTLLGGLVRLIYWAAPGRDAGDLPSIATVSWIDWAVRWEAIAAVAALLFGARSLFLWVRDGRRVKDFVLPTWEASCSAMGIAYHKRDARKMVTLPDGFVPPDGLEEDIPRWRRWAEEMIERPRLKREVREIERLAELEAAGEVDEEADVPGAELEVRPAAGIARYLGRKLDREPMLPSRREVKTPPVTIRLVPGKVATPAAKRAFLAAVSAPLGMPDALAEWSLRGRKPYVELRPNLLPPETVDFERVRKAFEKCGLAEPVIGLASGGRSISIDLDNNSPHTMVSGGSGTGKSVLLKALLCQRMHHGAGVIMCDYKRVSHRWLHALQEEGCLYAWRLAHIHDVLVACGGELNRRLEEVLPPDNDPDAEMQTFPTIDVVVEEINSTVILLNSYWQEQGNSGPSPAVIALKLLVNMGREYRMHVWIGAQRASASIFGANGGDIRESFQTRLMAKWTVQTWKMLAGNAEYRRPLGGRGIWARVQDDEVEVVRTPMLTNAQAVAWARSGTPCPVTTAILPDVRTIQVGAVRTDRTTARTDLAPELVALSKALPRLPGKALGIAGLRTAASKPDFPAPVRAGSAGRAALYDMDRLIEWKLGRDGFEEVKASFDQPAYQRRGGFVYALDTMDPETGDVVLGYVGKTVRSLEEREREHRGDKPWADLIVGSIRALWEGEAVNDEELSDLEDGYIRDLKPLYNVAGQKGAPHAVPLEEQIGARHLRDRALGRKLWLPRDVFNGGGRPAEGYGAYVLELAERSRTAFETR